MLVTLFVRIEASRGRLFSSVLITKVLTVLVEEDVFCVKIVVKVCRDFQHLIRLLFCVVRFREV